MWLETPTLKGEAVGYMSAPSRTEETPVSYRFTSSRNLEFLNYLIQKEVYYQTGALIDRQGEQEMRNVMMSIYTDSPRPHPESYINQTDVNFAVAKLNYRVLRWCTRTILSSMAMYKRYIYDTENPIPEPMSRGKMSDMTTGNKNNFQFNVY